MSRPLASSSALRRRRVLYLSSDEFAQIEREAQRARLSVSAFMRKAALQQQCIAAPAIAVYQWGKLAGLAANINQIAHRLNAGESFAAYDLTVLDALRLQLTEIRLQLAGEKGGSPSSPKSAKDEASEDS
jgi:hypothetical protein